MVRVIIFCFSLWIAGCSSESLISPTSGWTCQYCHNVILHQTGAGLWFDFPSEDGVHYVTKNLSGGGVAKVNAEADRLNALVTQQPAQTITNEEKWESGTAKIIQDSESILRDTTMNVETILPVPETANLAINTVQATVPMRQAGALNLP